MVNEVEVNEVKLLDPKTTVILKQFFIFLTFFGDPSSMNAEEDDEDDAEGPAESHAEANGYWWKKPSKAWTSRILTECNSIFEWEKDDLSNGG